MCTWVLKAVFVCFVVVLLRCVVGQVKKSNTQPNRALLVQTSSDCFIRLSQLARVTRDHFSFGLTGPQLKFAQRSLYSG